ncbi:GNAT family N-acetyltransferase [Natrarchaeobius sp. A-rgal3]|uniref:GNAT family N-acetyltransferase n=1 Tax=Natrarchaeobius versutus TaxID=1679078 RepID=UPI00350F33C2
MDVRELTEPDERREAIPTLRQLWTDRAPAEVLEWTGEEEYRLVGGFLEGELIAVAGVVVTDVLHHTTHAWLSDLVVDETHRGEGHGTDLLSHLEGWAAGRDCTHLALASPLEKTSTHRFYAKQGYEKWGYVIETEL